MKNDRAKHRRPREPVDRRRFAKKPSEGSRVNLIVLRKVTERLDLSPLLSKPPTQKLGGSYTPDQCWEKNKNKIPAFAGMTGGYWSSPPLGKPPTGFSEPDVGRPPDVECDIGLVMDTLLSSELETTRLTDAEIRNGCGLTMEEEFYKRKPPSNVELHWEKNRTQQSVAFEYTVSTQESDMVVHSHRPWLTIGGSYWKHLDCETTAARDFAGPIVNRGNRYWPPGMYWRDVGWLDTWDSVLVESVRLILQRWSRVYSFSLTICCTWQVGEREIVYRLHTGENKST